MKGTGDGVNISSLRPLNNGIEQALAVAWPAQDANHLAFGRTAMAIRMVRLQPHAQRRRRLRIGTVRRPPRGVPKAEFSKRDFYDTGCSTVAPSQAVMDIAHAAKTDK